MDDDKKDIFGTTEYFEDRWQKLNDPDEPYTMESYWDERQQMLEQMGRRRPPRVKTKV